MNLFVQVVLVIGLGIVYSTSINTSYTLVVQEGFNAKYIGRAGLETLVPLAIPVLVTLGIYSCASTNLRSMQFTTAITKTVAMYSPTTPATVVTVVYWYGYEVRHPLKYLMHKTVNALTS